MNDLEVVCWLCRLSFLFKARVALALPPSLVLASVLEGHWVKEHPFQVAWLDHWEARGQRPMRMGRALRAPIAELVPEHLRR